MKKIKSVNKIKQGLDGKLYYVSREIIKFNQTKIGFIAIYQEQLFDVVTEENGDKSIKIVETYEQVASVFSFVQVSQLFNMINQPISATDNFVDKFNEIQIQAMLIDTVNQTTLGRYGTKEWEIYDEAQLLAAA